MEGVGHARWVPEIPVPDEARTPREIHVALSMMVLTFVGPYLCLFLLTRGPSSDPEGGFGAAILSIGAGFAAAVMVPVFAIAGWMRKPRTRLTNFTLLVSLLWALPVAFYFIGGNPFVAADLIAHRLGF